MNTFIYYFGMTWIILIGLGVTVFPAYLLMGYVGTKMWKRVTDLYTLSSCQYLLLAIHRSHGPITQDETNQIILKIHELRGTKDDNED